MEHAQRSRPPQESASPLTARIQPPGWGEPQREQSPLPVYDFSHVDLFSHAPQRSPVQLKLNTGLVDQPQEEVADRGFEPETTHAPPDNLQPLNSHQVQSKPADSERSFPNFFPVDVFTHSPQRSPVQMKLTVGAPNDVYEQEADRVAEQVMGMAPSATPNVQRQTEEDEIQTKPAPVPPQPLSTPPNQTEMVYFAGVTQPKGPPDGLSFINQTSGNAILGGFAGGWTGVPNSVAFTLPKLDTKNTNTRKPNNVVEHFAEALPTMSADAQIESYYVGPGNYDGGRYTVKGKTYTYVYQISNQISDLIKAGEQEHINDTQRSYDITFKLIAEKINLLAVKGQKFGPAKNPEKADNLVWAELYKLLPPQLQTKYGGWVQMLDFLLKLTKVRDVKGWHSLDMNSKTQGNKVIYTVYKLPSTQINTVSSAQLVNYPPAKFE